MWLDILEPNLEHAVFEHEQHMENRSAQSGDGMAVTSMLTADVLRLLQHNQRDLEESRMSHPS